MDYQKTCTNCYETGGPKFARKAKRKIRGLWLHLCEDCRLELEAPGK